MQTSRSSFPARPLVLSIGALALGGFAALQAARQEPGDAPARPVLVPFLVEELRNLGVVDAQVLVANAGGLDTTLTLSRLRVLSDGEAIVDLPLARELPADPRYARASELVELLPHAHAHTHGDRERWFAAADAPELTGDAAFAASTEVDALVEQMRADFAAGVPEPFVHVDFALPTDQIFFQDDPAGMERTVELRLDYRDAGGLPASLSVQRTLRRLARPLAPPASLTALGMGVHAGDLHVHSCHGEAAGACAPSGDCAAESFQTSGSFTYAQLKSQFQALGLDWFTATDHSYCINSDSEYNTIVAECAALTDGSFLVLPDIELSSDEEGSQVGSDLGDLLCLIGTTSANHMGAHGITSRKLGGDDGFLGFCDGLFDDVLEPFSQNVTAIRAEGGYAIANHPEGDSFGWNSFAATQGLEANQLHGVEVWNGGSQSGQGGNVGRWVDWLLGGRILYAYSGSDTHDAAFAFGANHVVLDGESFNADNLESALKAGRVFLSNGHHLVFEVVQDGVALPMGTLQALSPSQPASTLTLRAHYNFGADTSTITVFRGRVGDGSETAACTSPPLTGEGVWECSATLEPTARSWYRAYSEGAGVTAYTNPVFFLPGSCSYTAYGEGLGAANIGTLASVSSPTLGSLNTLSLSGFSASSPTALVALSGGPIPTGSPLFGGFLLIDPAFQLLVPVALAGGGGSFTFQVPEESAAGTSFYWQAAAPDAGQPGGFAFSNGLEMTLCGLLE
ncbi:MAG: CehA/McbA family metallohydrolase [Planctomycetota bacterium]